MKKYILLTSFLIIFACENKLETDEGFVNTTTQGYKYYKAGEYDKAIEEFTPLLKSIDNSIKSNAYTGRGFSYMKLGKITSAKNDFDEALKVNDKHEDAMFGFMLIHFALESSQSEAKYLALIELREDYNFVQDQNLDISDAHVAYAMHQYKKGSFQTVYSTLVNKLNQNLSFTSTDDNLPFLLLPEIQTVITNN